MSLQVDLMYMMHSFHTRCDPNWLPQNEETNLLYDVHVHKNQCT